MLSSVGAYAAYNWMSHKGIVVVPQVSLSCRHQLLQNPYDITCNLWRSSPTFSNTSANGIRVHLYLYGSRLHCGVREEVEHSFFYNAAAGNSDLTSQNIFWSAGVKF